MEPEKSPRPAQTNYGIHLLKFMAIFFQIEVHAYNWLSGQLHAAAEVTESVYQAKLLLIKGGFSMVVPITAAAVLRMLLPIEAGESRLPKDYNFRPMLSVIGFLALIESLKQAIVYGWANFFSWNALHLIALCFLLILIVAKHSTHWLWPIIIGIFILTPPIYRFIEITQPYIPGKIVHPGAFQPLTLVSIAVFALVAGLLGRKIYKSSTMALRHKKRVMAFIAGLFVLASVLVWQMPFNYQNGVKIITLPIGILAGDIYGAHIWGFFPWAGMILIGYLIYDLILKFKASAPLLLGFLATGFLLVYGFYAYLSDVVLKNCSSQLAVSGFNPSCFNRTPEQVVLALGLFLIVVPICIGAEKIGFENGLVRAVSRSILWVYIFETSVLVWLSKYWPEYISSDYLVPTFTLFSLASCFGLALVLDKFKFKLAVTLKKTEI